MLEEIIGWLDFLCGFCMGFGWVVLVFAFAAGEVYNPGCKK